MGRRSAVRLAPVLALVASLALMSPSAHAAATVAGPLHITGNRITDAGGATLVLRGMHRNLTDAVAATGAEVSPDEVDWLTTGRTGSWGANVIRVPLGSAQWTGECPSLYSAAKAASYRSNIKTLIQTITGKGVVALLDLHASTAGCTSIGRHVMPDAPITQHFWSDAAAAFSGNPLVVFELYNEPHYVPDDEWRDGTLTATAQDCDLTPPYATGAALLQQKAALASCQSARPKFQAVGMQELYDLVATTAPNNLIMIDGPGWASSPSSKPITTSRGPFVYAFHPYTCPVPGDPCDTTDQAHANLTVLNRWKPTAAVQPIFVSEMGWPSHYTSTKNLLPTDKTPHDVYVDGASYYNETFAFLQQQNPKWGFIAFAFDGAVNGGFSLVSNAATFQPNSTGLPVFNLLQAQ